MERIDMRPDWVFSPQPMYIIGTKNEDGSPNFSVITWLGFTCDPMPCLMMSIGGSKRTKTNILRDGTFSANMVTEDNLWLADYFGCSKGELKQKNDVLYHWQMGRAVAVPTLSECHWVYECSVRKVIEQEGSHIFVAEVKNIQIDSAYREMDMKKIDLTAIRPAVYGPYGYFSIGGHLGNMNEWREHLEVISPEESANA